MNRYQFIKRASLSVAIIFALGWAQSQTVIRNGTISNAKLSQVVDSGGGAPCVASYANTGGTGNRTTTGNSSVLVTQSGVSGMGDSGAKYVDGNTTSAGQGFFSGGAVDASSWVQFDFGSGNAALITEAKYYQENSPPGASPPQGTWKWQGSNNASAWTDIGASFTLGGTATQTITTMSGNITQYRYYRLLGVSGTSSSGPWVYEMEFKICGLP